MSTLIREDVASKLKLDGKDKKVNLGTINKTDPLVVPEVSLHVSARHGSNRIEIPSAYVRPPSHFNMPARPSFTDKTDAYKHLEGIEFDEVDPEDITILIGAKLSVRFQEPTTSSQYSLRLDFVRAFPGQEGSVPRRVRTH